MIQGVRVLEVAMLLATLLGLSAPARAQDWPSFRGPDASGVADAAKPPTSWDVAGGRNVAWSAEIPGFGHSSPVVWGGRVFLTSAVPLTRPVGAEVTLRFRVPGSDEAIECEGTVCWIREYNVDTPDVAPGFGVRFGNLAPHSQLRIEAFVRERDPLFYDD